MADDEFQMMAAHAMAVRRAQAEAQLKLPLWEPPQRALPTEFARSALFTARNNSDLGETTRKIIPTDRAVIEYEGPLLNQGHADVWQCVMLACRLRQSLTVTGLRGSTLIRMVRNDDSCRVQTKDRAHLLKLIHDLSKGHVYVKHNDDSVSGATMLGYRRDEDDSYRITVDVDIAKLFWDDHVLIDWAVRAGIKGELAKWLQHYFAARLASNPTLAMLVERIRELSNSQTKDLKRFRQAVRAALAELVRVGALTGGEIDGAYALATIVADGTLPAVPARLGAPPGVRKP